MPLTRTSCIHFVENAIKDVTCRYSAKFMSKTRKLRIDREWWAQTLHPYETKERKRDNLEDTELKMNLMQQPFPTTIGEFKNHPLYVLEGDLLKFEAIYPESPAVLGYFRNKAIYSRDCVHIVRVIWTFLCLGLVTCLCDINCKKTMFDKPLGRERPV